MAGSAIDKEAALEALADARISLSYLKRLAVEAKDKSLAAKLTDQAAALKACAAALRKASHAEWAAQARGIGDRFKAAQEKLEVLMRGIEKDAAAIRRVAQAAGVVDSLLVLVK